MVGGVLTAAPAHAAVPDAPINVAAAAAGPGSATVSWTPAANNGGFPIVEFSIAAQPTDVRLGNIAGDQTSATLTNLPNGTYTFTVRARNSDGNSLASAPSNEVVITGGTDITVPDPPTNVTATPGDKSAVVNWTPPTNDGGSLITEYRVNVTPGQGVYQTASGSDTTLVFTGLTSGVEYFFTVQAKNTVGRSAQSAPSNTVVAGGTAATAPGAPANVRATAGAGGITVSWTAPSDGGSPIEKYRVSAQPGTAFRDVLAPSTGGAPPTSALFTGLSPTTSYSFKVFAVNSVGPGPDSLPSNSVSGSVGGVDAKADFSGDGRGDVIARRPNGELLLYAGDGAGSFIAARKIGAGWHVLDRILSPGDFNGDGRADLIGRKPNGELWLYPGTGTGGFNVKAYRRIGTGWQVLDRLLSPGDFNGDGRADLIGRKPNGELWLYPGTGTGGLNVNAYRRLGTGWQVYDRLLSAGDFNGDDNGDVMARKPNGELWLYAGDGQGRLVNGRRIGTGWHVLDRVLSAGDTSGEGKADVIGRKPNGELWLYPGTGSGGFDVSSYSRIGTGWQAFDIILGAGL
jgi:hypothetical protein